LEYDETPMLMPPSGGLLGLPASTAGNCAARMFGKTSSGRLLADG
jgi:hypothetical protein